MVAGSAHLAARSSSLTGHSIEVLMMGIVLLQPANKTPAITSLVRKSKVIMACPAIARGFHLEQQHLNISIPHSPNPIFASRFPVAPLSQGISVSLPGLWR